MKKVLDTINRFIINIDTMHICCDKYNVILPIKYGSVDINLIDELNVRIGINDLNINDIIIIFFRDINTNNIKPIKIIKLLSYTFNSDTSDSDTSDSDFENNI